MKIIDVTISPKGEVKVETKGFTGAECQEASRFIEEALGVRVSEAKTAEFYQGQCAEQRIEQSQ
jgi:hypothetical protein